MLHFIIRLKKINTKIVNNKIILKYKLIYVGFAFEHHKNTHAGYHQIKKFLPYDIIIDGQAEYNFVFKTIYKFPHFIVRRYRRYFGWRLWFTELRCIIRAVLFKNQIFHIIYGENILKNLGRFKGKNNKIICTYHQPYSIFKENKSWMQSIKKVDKIILVSNKDLKYFNEITNNIPVKFIPHGVNTEFFRPANVKREKSVLMVGNWLRDFSFANKVFSDLIKKDSEIIIHIVTNEENFKYFSLSPRILLKNNISNENLRILYQKSGLVFFPLVEFTANNAILEAASCNVDILIATNNKNMSYFNENYIHYLNLEVKQVVDFIIKKLNKFPDYSNKINNREFVVNNYSWNKVAQITQSYLEDIYNL